MDKISIIIPVYNVEKYLVRCLDTVINQTYKNIEVILIDDGSTDGSGLICDEYKAKDTRIVVVQKKNGGLSSARNVGMEIATGDYIGFVDSDDWISEDMFAFLYALIRQTNSDVAQIGYISTNDKISINNLKPKISIYTGKNILRNYLYEAKWSVCWRLFKTDVIKNKVEFPVDRIYEDFATVYKVLMGTKKIVISNQIKYFYFNNLGSISKRGLKLKDFDLLCEAEEIIELSKDESYSDIKKLAKVRKARSYFSLLAKMAFYGINDESINKKETIRKLNKELRKNYFLLMTSSNTEFNRKLMITMICINYNCFEKILQKYILLKK